MIAQRNHRPEFSQDYRVLSIVALVVFAMQLAALIAFSSFEWSRFSQTFDFQSYYQAWYEMVNQHVINPHISYPTVSNLFPDLDEFLFPLTAVLGVFSDSGLVLLIYQDTCAVVAEVIAFRWILAILDHEGRALPLFTRRSIVASSIIVAVALPWTYTACAFDYHHQLQGSVFFVAALYSFYRRKFRWGFMFAALTALTFVIAATFVIALGLTLLIFRGTRRSGVAILICGTLYLAVLRSIAPHDALGVVSLSYAWIGTNGSKFGTLGILADIVFHPGPVLHEFAQNWKNIYANSAPTLFLALTCPWTLPAWCLVYVENILAGSNFAAPGSQYAIVYATEAPGMAWSLVWFLKRVPGNALRRTTLCLTCLIAFNALGWGLSWIPNLPKAWIATSEPAASFLGEVHAAIPSKNQTIVSQGVSGRFGDKLEPMAYVGDLNDHPFLQPNLAFVLAPFDGIELATSEETLYAVQALLRDPKAKLEQQESEVWWFSYRPGNSKGFEPNVQERAAACTIGGASGKCLDASVLPLSPQFTRSIGPRGVGYVEKLRGVGEGFLLRQAYWRRAPGRYRFAVEAQSTGPLTIAISDATQRGRILARHDLVFGKKQLRTFDVFVDRSRDEVFSGHALFQDAPKSPPNGDVIEMSISARDEVAGRVWQVGIAAL